MNRFRDKQSTEAYYIEFDFSAICGSATVSSASVTATEVDTGTDVTATITTAASQSISGTSVYVWVKAGTSGTDYLITCKATASDGSIYELDGLMLVSDIPLVEAGAEEPVTVEEVKLWIRHGLPSTDGTEDGLIQSMITAARIKAEEKCKRSFALHDYEIVLSEFPGATDAITLPRPPISTASTDLVITYVKDTTAGDTTTVDATAITIDHKSEPGRVYPSYGNEWPDDVRDQNDAITITYKAGAASACPEPVRSWIKMEVAGYYAQREAFITGTMKTDMSRDFVDGLLDPFRILEASQ